MKAFYFLLAATVALGHAACFANPPTPASALPPVIPNSSVLLKDPSAGTGRAAASAKMVLPGIEYHDIKSSKDVRLIGIQRAGSMFRDARNRSPAMTILGGPAKSKNSPVISGTSVNHKPL